MRKLTIYLSGFIFFLASCTKEKQIEVRELNEITDRKLIEYIKNSNAEGIPFPEGSKAVQSGNGEVKIILPKGLRFVMTDPVKNIIIDDDVTGVTCTCTSGKGCSPVKYAGKYYCVMEEGCSVCTKKTTSSSGTAVEIEGVYKEDASITLLSKTKQTGLTGALTTQKSDLIGSASAALLRKKEVKKDLLDLYHFIYGEKIPEFILNNENNIPAGHKYIAVNIYGNAAAIPVPVSKIDAYAIIVEKVSCKCNDAKPVGCTKSSFLGAVYCQSNGCVSCSLID